MLSEVNDNDDDDDDDEDDKTGPNRHLVTVIRSPNKTEVISPRTEAEKKLLTHSLGGSVAECLACWSQAQKCLGSNRSRDAVG